MFTMSIQEFWKQFGTKYKVIICKIRELLITDEENEPCMIGSLTKAAGEDCSKIDQQQTQGMLKVDWEKDSFYFILIFDLMTKNWSCSCEEDNILT